MLGRTERLLSFFLHLFPRLLWSRHVQLQRCEVAGVTCHRFRSRRRSSEDQGNLVVYVHGGGFILGSVWSHAAAVAWLCRRSGCDILLPDYALGPVSRYPVALDQLTRIWDALRRDGQDPARVVWGGESAGANLLLALLQSCVHRQDALPGAAFLESPFLDLTFSGESNHSNFLRECILPGLPPFSNLNTFWLKFLYAGTYRTDDPRVSPLFGSFDGLPPLYFSWSETELLRDDARRAVAKARKAGIPVRTLSFANTPHGNSLFVSLYPESSQGIRAIAAFIRDQLPATGNGQAERPAAPD